MHSKCLAAALIFAGALGTSASHGQAVPPLGAQVLVNQTTLGMQSSPAAAFSGGRYLAVWTGPDRDQFIQVFGRLLNPAGATLGGEFLISSGVARAVLPRVAAGGGGFAVAWISQGVQLRLLDNAGQPRGEALRLDTSDFQVESCDVAVNAAGDILVVWSTAGFGGRVLARRVSPAGVPGEVMEVARSSQLFQASPRVAAAPDGGFLAVWKDIAEFFPGAIRARRLNAGGTWGDPFQVNEFTDALLACDARPLFGPDSSFSILWRGGGIVVPPILYTIVKVRSWDAANNPLMHEMTLDFNLVGPFDAVLAPSGDSLVLTADVNLGVHGRLFDRAWHALTGDIVFQPPLPVPQFEPAAAVDEAGDFLALWTLGPEVLPRFGDGSSTAVLGRPLGAIPCIPGSAILCLGPGGRFHARVAWANPFNGQTGTGHPRSLTADTGAFWFFGDQNLELMVKVLDGTAVNGHFWVYAGSLSNVEYTLTVTDTVTGAERSYHNPPFQFASRADVNAFPAAATGADTALQLAAMTAPIVRDAPVVGCLPVSAGPSTSLCLASAHFSVSVDFKNPRLGLTGHATAVPLTSDTGAFWFFSETNLELMVKVLDGRAVNGKFWVFFGALSDVEYTITVTRPETGEVRTYHNPQGNLASRADTQAF